VQRFVMASAIAARAMLGLAQGHLGLDANTED
jgi:hypothetical protein